MAYSITLKDKTKTLHTGGKYVKEDIALTVQDAVVSSSSASVTSAKATASIQNLDGDLIKLGTSSTGLSTTAPSGKTLGTDYWRIAPVISSTTNGSVGARSINVTTAGFVPTGNIGTIGGSSVGVTGSVGSTYYISKSTFSSSGAGALSAPSISRNTTAGTKATNVSSILGESISTSEPTSGYYIRLNTAANSTGKTVSVSCNAAGYTKTGEVGKGTVTLSGSSNQYLTVTAATNESVGGLNNYSAGKISINSVAPASGESYTLATSAYSIATSQDTKDGSYYYIKITAPKLSTSRTLTKGYKITGAGYTGTLNSTTSSVNVTAETSGNKYIKIPKAAASISSSVSSKTYDGTSTTALSTDILLSSNQSLSSYYKIVMTPSSSTSSTTSGYLGSSSQITNNTGTSLTRYLKKGSVSSTSIGYGASSTVSSGYYANDVTIKNNIGAGSITATPAVTQKTYDGTSTTALSTDILLSSAPSSGNYYKVEMDPSVSISVGTAGYISSSIGNKNAANGTTVNRYIPKATPAFDGGGLSSSASNITLSDTNNGISFTVNRGSVLYNGAVNGWVNAADNKVALGSGTLTKYISKITIPSGKTLGSSSALGVDIIGTLYAGFSTSGSGSLYLKDYGGSSYTQVASGGKLITTSMSSSVNGATVTVSTGTGWITSGSKSATVARGVLSVSAETTNNSVPSGYTEDSSIKVPTKGWLLIGDGYYQKTAISLDTILGGKDDGETFPITSGHIRSGYKAYNIDGELITGAITDWSPSSTYYTDTNTGFGAVTGGTYVTATKYIKAGAGSVSLSGTGSNFTPVISKYTTDGSNAGKNIHADTGSITTTEPTSGYYVAVQSASQTAKTISADASIGTAGWMPTNYDFSAKSGTVGLNASSATYVPINSAVITNGFITKAGYIPDDDNEVYTTVYNSADDCVDVIFSA